MVKDFPGSIRDIFLNTIIVEKLKNEYTAKKTDL